MAMSFNLDENLAAAVDKVEEAAAQGAEVVCLPELFRSPYFCQREDAALFDLAEPVPGPSTSTFSTLAQRLGVAVVVPVFERRAPGLYRKMHIPDDPAFYEKYYFTPGDLGFKVFDTQAARIGALICWDQWYPEGARLTALQGASCLFYPTAIGWHPQEKAQHGAAQRDAWKTIQRGHAIANGVYVAAVNRVGHEPGGEGQAGLEFWGTSFVCDPFGVVVAEASVDKEEVLVVEVSLDRIEEVRRNWPFLRDRRIDAYRGIEQRFID